MDDVDDEAVRVEGNLGVKVLRHRLKKPAVRTRRARHSVMPLSLQRLCSVYHFLILLLKLYAHWGPLHIHTTSILSLLLQCGEEVLSVVNRPPSAVALVGDRVSMYP